MSYWTLQGRLGLRRSIHTTLDKIIRLLGLGQTMREVLGEENSGNSKTNLISITNLLVRNAGSIFVQYSLNAMYGRILVWGTI